VFEEVERSNSRLESENKQLMGQLAQADHSLLTISERCARVSMKGLGALL
jgi:hypothetical protein